MAIKSTIKNSLDIKKCEIILENEENIIINILFYKNAILAENIKFIENIQKVWQSYKYFLQKYTWKFFYLHINYKLWNMENISITKDL